MYVRIVGKILNQHLSVWLFSNPGKKVQILVESTGQICPVFLHLFLTLSPGFENNHTFKCWSGIFPTILSLYCDERRDRRWNISWARGKSWGRSLRDFPRAQAIFHRVSRLESQYRHSQLPNNGSAAAVVEDAVIVVVACNLNLSVAVE